MIFKTPVDMVTVFDGSDNIYEVIVRWEVEVELRDYGIKDLIVNIEDIEGIPDKYKDFEITHSVMGVSFPFIPDHVDIWVARKEIEVIF